MTISVIDTWYESAMSPKVVAKRILVTATSEEFVLTAAQLGMSDIYSAVGTGVEAGAANVYGVTAATAGGPGTRVRLRSAGADTWNTGAVSATTRLMVKGLAA